MDDWWQNDSYRGDFWKSEEPSIENAREALLETYRLYQERMNQFTREELLEWRARASCHNDRLALAAIKAQLAYLKRKSLEGDSDKDTPTSE